MALIGNHLSLEQKIIHMLKNFSLHILYRIALLSLVMAIGIVALFQQQYIIGTVAVIVLVGLIYNLLQFVNNTNKDVANFLAGIRYDDFTSNTSSNVQGSHFDELHESFSLINRKFRDIRAEKEANYQFLQTLVQHVEVGLLGVDENNKVILTNKALQKLLRKSYISNIAALGKIDERLLEAVRNLKSGQRELVKVSVQNKLLQLSIQVTEITLQKEPYRLFSFQNIQSELEAQELDSWQKLIRTLTHEIMNSVAPINSLSSTLSNLLNESDSISDELLQQLRQSLVVIQKRSDGLMGFTETYRKLTRIPLPQFQIIDVAELISAIEILLQPDFEAQHIQFIKQLPEKQLQLTADPNLLEQVLINLLKNSIAAVQNRPNPTIEVHVFPTENDKVSLHIKDNGTGIPEAKLDQIFIPFYTTKAEGSGIGLSLSLQIIRLHKGTLTIQSKEGEGTMAVVVL